MNIRNDRFDVVDQEQLAAQIVAVMGAHFQRPTPDQQRKILQLAEQQITAEQARVHDRELSCAE